jgi:TonB family protein
LLTESNVEVEGHTDNVGNAESNKKLSEQRAKAVMDYLISRGVEASRLKSVGYGLVKPVADNSTEEGRAKNRRVELVISDDIRSKQEIMQVVNARMPGLRNIYNSYLKLKPDFSGKVVLEFTIAPSGDIISISIVSSTTGYAEFDNAVKNMVGTYKWKAIKSGNTTPTIPFSFKK